MTDSRGPLAFRILLFIGVLTLSSTAVQAQLSAASLNGVVRDPQGAVIDKATVLLRNADTGFERTTSTNDSGAYVVLGKSRQTTRPLVTGTARPSLSGRGQTRLNYSQPGAGTLTQRHNAARYKAGIWSMQRIVAFSAFPTISYIPSGPPPLAPLAQHVGPPPPQSAAQPPQPCLVDCASSWQAVSRHDVLRRFHCRRHKKSSG